LHQVNSASARNFLVLLSGAVACLDVNECVEGLATAGLDTEYPCNGEQTICVNTPGALSSLVASKLDARGYSVVTVATHRLHASSLLDRDERPESLVRRSQDRLNARTSHALAASSRSSTR
jgi:hypothetical protein